METALGAPPPADDMVAWRIRLQALAELRALNEPMEGASRDDASVSDAVLRIP